MYIKNEETQKYLVDFIYQLPSERYCVGWSLDKNKAQYFNNMKCIVLIKDLIEHLCSIQCGVYTNDD